MGERFTREHLTRALEHLHKVAGAKPGTSELEGYTPADRTMYRVTNAAGSVNVFGDRYWIGASEAYFGIHSIAKAIAWAREHAPEASS